MRKVFALAFAVLMTVVTIGCNETKTTKATTPQGTSQTAAGS